MSGYSLLEITFTLPHFLLVKRFNRVVHDVKDHEIDHQFEAVLPGDDHK